MRHSAHFSPLFPDKFYLDLFLIYDCLNNCWQYIDEHLTQLLSTQDSPEAFEELYNRYWDKCLTLARHKLGSETDAEEIVQQVFLNIWRARKTIQLTHSFRTYISSCIKYETMACLARQKKQEKFRLSLRPAEAVNHTQDWLDYECARQQLEATVKLLPEKCRFVFLLSRENGFSEKQIAKALEISPKTVQAHMTKALKLLRTNLQLGLFIIYSASLSFLPCSAHRPPSDSTIKYPPSITLLPARENLIAG